MKNSDRDGKVSSSHAERENINQDGKESLSHAERVNPDQDEKESSNHAERVDPERKEEIRKHRENSEVIGSLEFLRRLKNS